MRTTKLPGPANSATPQAPRLRIPRRDVPERDEAPLLLSKNRGRRLGYVFVAMLALFILPPLFLNQYLIYLSSLLLIYVLAASGLNLMLGYAGQISLAQGAFVGIGAYTVGLFGTHLGWSFWITLPCSALIGFLFGILIGFPSLRVHHHYLAFVTLGFNIIFILVLKNESWLTGGALGLTDVQRPSIAGISLASDIGYHIFVATVSAIALLGVFWVVNSQWGRAFKAIRENEDRAQMLGVDVRRYKLFAFAIGSALAAIAGAMLGPLLGFIDPTAFTDVLSLYLLLMVVIGGRGRFEGPLFGAAIVVLLPELLRAFDEYFNILFGLGALAILLFKPSGLVVLVDSVYRLVTGRRLPRLSK